MRNHDAGTAAAGEAGYDGAAAAERRFDDRAGTGSLSRAEARRDVTVRRWGVVTPAATRIGRAERPDADLSESVRRLHDEQHTATKGHSRRTHRLDRLRITQALCNALDLTPWQRDRALGVMDRLDLTAFGSQRAVPKVALVAINHVVDAEQRRYLGLHDAEYVRGLPEERLAALHERYRELAIATDDAYRRLLDRHDLDITSVNRLTRTLREQLDEEAAGAAFGRSPYRDPNLSGVRDLSGARET